MKEIIMLYGPPGSGKTTQALKLKNKFDWEYISWGNIIREILSKKKYLEFFDIVYKTETEDLYYPENFIKNLIEKEIRNTDKKSIILDGFPRTELEYNDFLDILKKNNFKLKFFINFNTSFEFLKKRVLKRKICSICGSVYANDKTVCENDSSILINRHDDNESDVKKRFENYKKDTVKIIPKLINLAEYSFFVDAAKEEELLYADILNGVYNNKKISKIYNKVSEANLPTTYGEFKIVAFQNIVDYSVHLAMVYGNVFGKFNVPVRIHSSCITGDIFHSLKCDCGEQLDYSMKYVVKYGYGIVMYLFQEGRGINIINKIKAYSLQEKGLDTVQANEELGLPSEMRKYEVVKDILQELKVLSIDLLTNNPDKIHKISAEGVIVERRIPIKIKENQFNKKYLNTKKNKMNHLL